MNTKMPIGIEDFKEAREGYYLVDKTEFIKEMIDDHAKVTLITRPRRFGKTLTLSMLDYFFSINKQSDQEDLFADLSISKAGDKYKREQGQHPVIFFSLKNIEGLKWKNMEAQLRLQMGSLFISFKYLLKSNDIDADLKKRFSDIADGTCGVDELAGSLSLLLHIMHLYYKKPVILLLDEYDAPVQKAWANGYYRDCISFMRTYLGSTLKTNPDLDFAVLTGVLRIAKESLFSGLNNLKVCSILSDQYANVMGFTPEEVSRMAQELGKGDEVQKIRYWYDGYHFGNRDIYNPWSVINYFDEGTFGDYWVHTGENSLITRMLKNLSSERADILQSLLNGNKLTATVREGLIYDDIENDEDALYSMLLTTGYLTVIHKELDFDGYAADLVIPNREVQDAYRSEIVGKMRRGLSSTRLKVMLHDLITGNEESFTKALAFYIEYLASSFDTANKESFYHGFVLGMTALLIPDYEVVSNREAGYGRFDLAIIPHESNHTGVLIEFKRADREENLQKAADAALSQIHDRDYGAEFKKKGIIKYWKYGIAFYGKKVFVKKE